MALLRVTGQPITFIHPVSPNLSYQILFDIVRYHWIYIAVKPSLYGIKDFKEFNVIITACFLKTIYIIL